MDELKNKCTWQWTTQGGKNGYYWSSSHYGSDPNYACDFYFDSGYYNVGWNDRYSGHSVLLPIQSPYLVRTWLAASTLNQAASTLWLAASTMNHAASTLMKAI